MASPLRSAIVPAGRPASRTRLRCSPPGSLWNWCPAVRWPRSAVIPAMNCYGDIFRNVKPAWQRPCCWSPGARGLGARTEPFVTTGTVHLLAISGVHVGILAPGVLVDREAAGPPTHGGHRRCDRVRRFVRPVHRRWPACGPCSDPGDCLLPVRLSVCCASGFNALAAAAVAVVAWSPSAMLQAGTQLSFLADATIIC